MGDKGAVLIKEKTALKGTWLLRRLREKEKRKHVAGEMVEKREYVHVAQKRNKRSLPGRKEKPDGGTKKRATADEMMGGKGRWGIPQLTKKEEGEEKGIRSHRNDFFTLRVDDQKWREKKGLRGDSREE